VELLKKKKSKRRVAKSRTSRSVENSTVGYKVIVAFIIIFRMCTRKAYNEKIQFAQ